ncbi:hypothetical protein AVEN_70611-1 [Araneus ventricosus]|uniref:Uncharacterized protein n=1 Tax=Araneus ventricosus TaxID=182803 RepID=A0A4Y2CH32_ARAVE|nr:hypothetical protein AVEN_70611-1 [Araneus ventricosus]
MLSDGIIILHDNTHTDRKTQELLQMFEWEIWSPPPIHSKHLFGTRFSSDSDVKTAADNWSNGQGRDFQQAWLNKLVLSSDKCLNRLCGKVIGKYPCYFPFVFSV